MNIFMMPIKVSRHIRPYSEQTLKTSFLDQQQQHHQHQKLQGHQ